VVGSQKANIEHRTSTSNIEHRTSNVE